jgi:hypothetical protein
MKWRRIVIVALFALAEASIIEPLLLLLPTPLRFVDRGIALAVTWVLLCGIAFSRRWLALRDASMTAQRVVVGAWLMVMLVVSVVIVNLIAHLDLLSLGVLFIEFGGVLLVWWRGMALGITPLGPDAARLRLQFGILLFVMFTLATAFNASANLLVFIIPFLVGALFAMPLSHIERVEQSERGRTVEMDGRWWRLLFVGVGTPLAISIILAMLVSGDLLADGIRLLVLVLLIPILAVAFVVGYLLSLILSLLFSKIQPVQQPLQALNDFLKQLQPTDQNAAPVFYISPELRFVIGVIILLGIIGAILWFTSRARREEAIKRVQADNLLDFQEDIAPPVTLVGELIKSLSLRRWLAVMTIRRIYARMTHEAGKRGYSRLFAQTPFDYLPALSNAFPNVLAELNLITNAYVAAHYGEVPDTDGALAQIRAAWDRVRAVPRAAPRQPSGEPQSAEDLQQNANDVTPSHL